MVSFSLYLTGLERSFHILMPSITLMALFKRAHMLLLQLQTSQLQPAKQYVTLLLWITILIRYTLLPSLHYQKLIEGLFVGISPWKRCLERLEGELSPQQFNTWIRPLHAIESDDAVHSACPEQVCARLDK